MFLWIALGISFTGAAFVAGVYLYEKGQDDGYKEAQRDIQTKAENNVKTTQNYVRKAQERVGVRAPMIEVYMKDYLKMYLLPRWNVTLLGSDYVIRRPLTMSDSDYKFQIPLKTRMDLAWFLSRQDSETLDESIYQLLNSTEDYVFNKEEADGYKSDINNQIDALLESAVNKLLIHIPKKKN